MEVMAASESRFAAYVEGLGVVRHLHASKEITNEASKFHEGRNWDLFTNYRVQLSWNGMPPKWQRIFFFPNHVAPATE